ncbi:hypothetical protein Tco_0148475, partial [Tanacetum coccineum]
TNSEVFNSQQSSPKLVIYLQIIKFKPSFSLQREFFQTLHLLGLSAFTALFFGFFFFFAALLPPLSLCIYLNQILTAFIPDLIKTACGIIFLLGLEYTAGDQNFHRYNMLYCASQTHFQVDWTSDHSNFSDSL